MERTDELHTNNQENETTVHANTEQSDTATASTNADTSAKTAADESTATNSDATSNADTAAKETSSASTSSSSDAETSTQTSEAEKTSEEGNDAVSDQIRVAEINICEQKIKELNDCYTDYVEYTRQLIKDTPRWHGILGSKSKLKNDPAHMKFIDEVETRVQELLTLNPTPEQLYAVAELLIHAAVQHFDEDFIFWTLMATQRSAKSIVPLLTPEECVTLRDYYNEHIPKKYRMPIHKELYKLLDEYAKK